MNDLSAAVSRPQSPQSSPELAAIPYGLTAEEYHTLPWSEIRKRREKALRAKPPGAPTFSRKPFFACDKKAVCEMYMANPHVSHQVLADHFGVDRSMITRTLKDKDKWLVSKHSDGQKFARRRVSRFWDLESAMEHWLLQCRKDDLKVSDKMIRERAIHLAEVGGMRGGQHRYQFRCGKKWLTAFKQRFGITDGVATRLGYTETDLAREKAYGRYPLDEPFWRELPDEDGNLPERRCSGPRKASRYDDMESEICGDVLVYRPRRVARGSSEDVQGHSIPPAPGASNSSASPLASPGTSDSSLVHSDAIDPSSYPPSALPSLDPSTLWLDHMSATGGHIGTITIPTWSGMFVAPYPSPLPSTVSLPDMIQPPPTPSSPDMSCTFPLSSLLDMPASSSLTDVSPGMSTCSSQTFSLPSTPPSLPLRPDFPLDTVNLVFSPGDDAAAQMQTHNVPRQDYTLLVTVPGNVSIGSAPHVQFGNSSFEGQGWSSKDGIFLQPSHQSTYGACIGSDIDQFATQVLWWYARHYL